MKAEILEPEPFRPILLTLETPDELKLLYHVLNVGSAQTLNDYSRAKCLGNLGPPKLVMFNQLLRVCGNWV